MKKTFYFVFLFLVSFSFVNSYLIPENGIVIRDIPNKELENEVNFELDVDIQNFTEEEKTFISLSYEKVHWADVKITPSIKEIEKSGIVSFEVNVVRKKQTQKKERIEFIVKELDEVIVRKSVYFDIEQKESKAWLIFLIILGVGVFVGTNFFLIKYLFNKNEDKDKNETKTNIVKKKIGEEKENKKPKKKRKKKENSFY